MVRSEPLVVLLSGDEVEVLAPHRNRRRRRTSPEGAARVGAGSEALEGEPASGGVRLVRFSHDLPLGKPLAQFLVAQLKEHGVPRRPIRLALADNFLPAKIVEIPSLLPRDLQAVVTRRAAAIIDAEAKEITYSGIALDGEDNEERRWLLHPIVAKPLVALQTELRSLGWSVRDVIPARTAPFMAERTRALATNGRAAIVIVFDHGTTSLGLVSTGRLAHLSTLPGSLEDHLKGEQTARSLVQELRGVDAFWRRSSRGDQVTDILVLGAVPAAIDVLRPAIQSALGNVNIGSALGGTPPRIESESALNHANAEARIQILQSLRSPRASVLDLALPLRPRARSVAAVGMASLVCCVTIALAIRHDLAGLASSISTEARVVEARSSDLEVLQERKARMEFLESRVLGDCEELRRLETFGVSAHGLIHSLRDAFDQDAKLLSVRAMGQAIAGAAVSSSKGELGVLQIRGLVVNQAGKTALALERLGSRLEAIPGLNRVSIEPPSLSDQGDSGVFGPGVGSLRFLATAKLTQAGDVGRSMPPSDAALSNETFPGGE